MLQTASRQTEQALLSQGYQHIVGIDEVGRGACAGPVVAGAVSFASTHSPIAGIIDSKQLSARKRVELSQRIQQDSEWGIGMASVQEINELGISRATLLAMQRAVDYLPQVDYVLVDGIISPQLAQVTASHVSTIIKGDQLVYAIAAASIIAKVYRDELMTKLHAKYSAYCWDKNKGYGTTAHRQAVHQFGISPHHRSLFVRGW